MTRIVMTDGSGAWFNDERAIKFSESTYFDGRNFISKATGSQWEHQVVYFTKSGRWVINRYSQWQGSSESYEFMCAEHAYKWLLENEQMENGHSEAVRKLPEQVRDELLGYVNASEV